jgi:GAF domain-containing protein
MQCPRCQQDNPSHAKFCLECGTPAIGAAPARPYADLKDENEGLRRSLTAALDQQTATSEILRVISRSPTALEPVAQTIADSAGRLCNCAFSAVFRFDGELIHWLAARGASGVQEEALRGVWPRPPDRETLVGRAILARETLHIHDAASDPTHAPSLPTARAALAIRSWLGVPILLEGELIGIIALVRFEVRPFSEREIALAQTFANQAAIAIENVRLFTELEARNKDLTRALDRETATSEILRVISRSPTDVQPVFDAIVRSAVTLCGAILGAIYRRDGGLVRLVGLDPRYPHAEEVRAAYPAPVTSTLMSCRAIHENAIIRLPDTETPGVLPPEGLRLARLSGFRSVVAVPMRREGEPIGAILVGRPAVGAFPDEQIGLLQAFADQAVIAIENVRLFKELAARNRDLTATSEILQVISRSPTDVQPVLDTIAERAMPLCSASLGAVFMFDGELIHLSALANVRPEGVDALRKAYPRIPSQGGNAGRVILLGDVVEIPDVLADPDYQLTGAAAAAGFRSTLGVPMLHQGRPIGVIVVSRPEPGAFSGEQIQLLRTFADQAVIAVENVRLFKETKEALEQQTATSEILRVISSSPTGIQPVLDAIAENAARVCGAADALIVRAEGDVIRRVAHFGTLPLLLPDTRPFTGHSMAGRAMLEGRTIHVPDMADPIAMGEYPESKAARNYRTQLTVPLMHKGAAIGAIIIRRVEARPFTDKQIALLQTFADQAVIAIENVRLFRELEEKNRALTQAHAKVTESLEQQTATAEILRVISQSQTEVQPVFDAIVDNAMRLFRAWAAAIVQLDGQLLHLVAVRGGRPGLDQYLREQSPWSIHGPTPVARCIAQRTVIHVADTESDRYADEAIREIRSRGGMHSVLAAPMLRNGQPIGGIWISRAEAGPFSPAEIALLQTFADQAVIAIQNAQLLGELRARTEELTRSVDQLTALGEVSRAVSSTLDLETVLTTIVSRAVELSGLDGGVVFEYDETAEEFVQRAMTETSEALADARRTTRIRKGEGVLGRTAITLEPVQVPDIALPGAYEGRLRETLIVSGVRAILAVPMVREGQLIGCLAVTRNQPGDFLAETIELLRTFATQSALAIQNARLFHEIADKSRQLEAASRHKSEFLANMSHELRTPLNAIIGFSEVLTDRMFGELNDKQDEYLKDIYASGQHLLSLINDILDLSKIEAGRMELEATDFDLPSAIDNALILVRERATRRGITLGHSVDERLGSIRGDERKVKQVLLNLLSNALKFTPAGGRIDVSARLQDGVAEISVTDTGVGIAPEDQEAVFEEFRQVGTADKKVEGTGLGLALSRKFIELHGGRIWVESEVGKGSTFRFTLPVRCGG